MTTTRTYTYGTTPEDAIGRALVDAGLRHYELRLNPGDLLAVLAALAHASDLDAHGPERRDRIVSLRTGILETIGIEEV